MTRLGYQIPNFTYPGVGPAELFEVVARQAVEAEQAGFDTIMLMDHFYQLPMMGAPDNFMLECYTTLGALARETSTARLGALVTGNTYRNPALLAKTITALDIASGGRAQLGIGAGWFELEHDSLGYEFGTFTDRFQKLEESLQIILPMLRDERPSLDGAHYSVKDAINQPPPISTIPVMIGGSGEKKTLRMVAQYATDSNMTSSPEEMPRKLDVLAAHCERLGRDRSEITVTQALNVCIADTHQAAEDDLRAFLGQLGMDLDALDDAIREVLDTMVVWGDADEVGEKMTTILGAGADGFTCSLPANGHIPGRATLLGTTAAKVLAGA